MFELQIPLAFTSYICIVQRSIPPTPPIQIAERSAEKHGGAWGVRGFAKPDAAKPLVYNLRRYTVNQPVAWSVLTPALTMKDGPGTLGSFKAPPYKVKSSGFFPFQPLLPRTHLADQLWESPFRYQRCSREYSISCLSPRQAFEVVCKEIARDE